jgi:hypothetical protein
LSSSVASGGGALPRIVPLANGQYRMFFSNNLTEGGNTGGIYSAISSDGLNFTVEPGIRIAASAVTMPSDALMHGLAIATLPNGTYRMYFVLESQSLPPNPNPMLSATSSDMLNWTIDPGVRIGPGATLGTTTAFRHPFAVNNGDGSVTLFYYELTGSAQEGVRFSTSSDGLNFTSDRKTSVCGPGANCAPCGDPSVYALPDGRLRMYYNNYNPANGITTLSSATSVEPAPGLPALVSSVLPASRSVAVGSTATAFATIINAGLGQGLSCSIAPATSVSGTFTYQTTNPTTNAVTGSVDTPVDIAAGAAQSFVFALSPSAPVSPTALQLSFMCGNGGPAPSSSGLNTLLFSASSLPVPDIVALAASGDPGYIDISGATGTGAFAVATVNLGIASSITVSANTGAATLPVTLAVCQTDPASGRCLAPPAASATTTIAANATPTFGIFVTGNGTVANAPGSNRVFVTFTDAGGALRGETSVAVRTQ